MTNPYFILDVSKTATPDEIKTAYRRASKDNHPDVGGDAETMAQIAKAYEILSDPERRARYDATGQTEPEIDHIEAQARQEFFQMCEIIFFQERDKNFKAHIAQFRRDFAANIAKQEADVKKLRALADAAKERIQKSPEQDMLTGLIAQKLAACDAAEAKLRDAPRIMERAFQLWEEYEISDAVVQTVMMGGPMWMTTGSATTGNF